MHHRLVTDVYLSSATDQQGWSIDAISVYQSGFPLQITQSTNNNSVFGYASSGPAPPAFRP